VLVFVGVVMVKSRHAKPKAKTSWQTVLLSVTPRERQMITDLITVVYTLPLCRQFQAQDRHFMSPRHLSAGKTMFM
jgi:hypothetical protein